MPFTFRKRLRLGPFRFNITGRGLSSVSTVVGWFTHNSRTGRVSVDLPGPVNWHSRGRRRSLR